jgi:hypothetical protein
VLLSSFRLGNIAAISVYPGRNRIKGSPNTIRNTFEGKRAIKMIRRTDRRFMAKSKFPDRTFNMPSLIDSTRLKNQAKFAKTIA